MNKCKPSSSNALPNRAGIGQQHYLAPDEPIRKGWAAHIFGAAVVTVAVPVALDLALGTAQIPFVDKSCANPVAASGSAVLTVFARMAGRDFFYTTPRNLESDRIPPEMKDRKVAAANKIADLDFKRLTVELPAETRKCYFLPSNYLVTLTAK